MKVIYVSGKYTADKVDKVNRNIRIARDIGIKLWEKGYAVITPHCNTNHFESTELTYEDIMLGDIELIRRCDCVYMVYNWKKSKGAIRERDLAIKLNLPIYYDLDSVPNEKM